MEKKKVEYILGNGETIEKIRLYAGDGKVLTNDGGKTVWNCIDVDTPDGWEEIEEVIEEENIQD